MALLRTPYRFTPAVVRTEVDAGTPGSYVLGDDAGGGLFVPRYAGRSDLDIQDRLAGHDRLYSYEYFIFRRAEGPREAFIQECGLWHGHRQQDYDLDNEVHPAVPDELDLRCPYCNFADHLEPLQIA